MEVLLVFKKTKTSASKYFKKYINQRLEILDFNNALLPLLPSKKLNESSNF